jgi:hypothetical protein
MADKLHPRTDLFDGPVESLIELEQTESEYLPEGGGDTAALDSDTNIGGAPSTAGLDSGGAVGVLRGRSVGRPGYEYENRPHGETTSDVGAAAGEAEFEEELGEEGEEESVLAVEDRGTELLSDWADERLPH